MYLLAVFSQTLIPLGKKKKKQTQGQERSYIMLLNMVLDMDQDQLMDHAWELCRRHIYPRNTQTHPYKRVNLPLRFTQQFLAGMALGIGKWAAKCLCYLSKPGSWTDGFSVATAAGVMEKGLIYGTVTAGYEKNPLLLLTPSFSFLVNIHYSGWKFLFGSACCSGHFWEYVLLVLVGFIQKSIISLLIVQPYQHTKSFHFY